MGKESCRQEGWKKVISCFGTESELYFLPFDSVNQNTQMSKVSLEKETHKVDQFLVQGIKTGLVQGVKTGSWGLFIPKHDLSTLITL